MNPQSLNLALAALAALGVIVIALFVMRDHRTLLPVLWFTSVCFVPVWLGVNVSVLGSLRTYIAPAVGCALVLVLVLALLPSIEPVRWTGGDLWILALFVTCLSPVLINASSQSIIFTTLTEWVLGFALGRLMPAKVPVSSIYRTAAVIFVVVAALGIIEFVAHWNPFIMISRSNALYANWGHLQERGGIFRVEGAFGHSIAFGCSLALAIPLLMASRVSGWFKGIGLVLIGGAALVSFSRLGMLCSAVAVVLSLLFLRKENSLGLRAVIALTTGVLALVVAPFASSVFTDAGQEATGSADYRTLLISLLPDMAPLGISPQHTVSATGTPYYGSFQSIDNTVILSGLRYGWIPMLIMVGIMVSAVIALLRRRATPPLIALVALIPAMVSVALITQFAILVWFAVGLAAHQQSRWRPPPTDLAVSGNGPFVGAGYTADPWRSPAGNTGTSTSDVDCSGPDGHPADPEHQPRPM